MPTREPIATGSREVEVSDPNDEACFELSELIEHFNANCADTMLLLLRHAAVRPHASDAAIARIDLLGVDFDIVVGGLRDRARLDFREPATTTTEVHDRILAELARARTAVGNRVPLTSYERQLAATRSLPTYVSQVVEVTDRSPNLREIVLGGGLDEFVSSGGDQFAYLMVQQPGGPEVPLDHTMAAQLRADPGTAPIAAYYTVRSWDARAHRLTLWMVQHGHPGSVGGWAQSCEIGERVALWGPRAGFGVRHDATSWLFVTDESGLGAVAALLDELPAGASARVFAETMDAGHVVDLPEREGVVVAWLYRGDDEPGTGNRLLDAVRSLQLTDDSPRGLVAFGAGESRQMTRIRNYLRQSIGIASDRVSMTGYWRRRVQPDERPTATPEHCQPPQRE